MRFTVVLDDDTSSRLLAHALDRSNATPGHKVSRSDLVREGVIRLLDAASPTIRLRKRLPGGERPASV